MTTPTHSTLQGRIIYLMIAVIFIGTAYPLSELGLWGAIGFNVLYSGVYTAGAYMVAGKGRALLPTLALAVITLALGTASFILANAVLSLIWFGAVFLFQVAITYVLLRFIFRTERVNRDVLYAGITAYLLIAYSFIPLYNLIESFAPGSFVTSTGAELVWQRFLYYSMATITTVGYGDIVPVSAWAQALAGMEAAIGVLYVAILMGRLVGLYAHERSGVL